MTVSGLRFMPPVIAHRGARGEAPENTLAAFRAAVISGARWIETDVKLTHDGIPILMHDDTVDRTTNGHGAVADTTWAEMEKLDAGGYRGDAFKGEKVPRLIDGMNFMVTNKLRLNLELKPCPGRTQATVMVTLIEMAKFWPQDYPPPLLSSFDIEALIIAERLHPDWPRGLLLDEWRDDWEEIATKINAVSLHLNEKLITMERMPHFKKAGFPILAYTVNDTLRAKELLHMGVSAVFSDKPAEIIKAL